MTDDVFAGTAAYYARFRAGFADEAYRAVIDAFGLDGGGRLLDVGCGTGEVALALAPHVTEAVGIDVSEEMLDEARRQTAARGVSNVEWRTMPAEAVDGDLGTFRLVTIGNALHWMDRELVLTRCYERTEPGGGIALFDSPGILSIDHRATDTLSDLVWQVTRRWLGERRRAGGGYYTPEPRRHEEILAQSPYQDIETGEAMQRIEWSVDDVVGYVYSTSFANRRLLGDRAEGFEADLRELLQALSPDGRFVRELRTGWVIGRRR